MLFSQIWPWVRTTLEASKVRVEQDDVNYGGFYEDFHTRIDNFEGQIGARLCEVQFPNLPDMHEKMAILQSEVRLLTESYFLVLSLVIPTFMQPFPKLAPIVFDLFMKDDVALIIGAKGGLRRTYKI